MFGFVQSPPDNRDWCYAAVKYATSLPASHLYPDTPLRDQGPYGSCVGFGSANMKDIQEMSDSQLVASPRYIYTEARKIDGLPDSTEGTTLRAALTVLKNKGVCPEADYPYSGMPNMQEATKASAETIAKGKIEAYARCYTVEDIKQALVNDGPVLIGMLVTDTFTKLGVGIHHVETMFGGSIAGGHCMLITGYDDIRTANGKKGYFRVKNSWKNWGENGYFWLAYDVVNERTDMGMATFLEAWSTVDLKTGFTGSSIFMKIGSTVAYLNGQEVSLDAPPVIINNRTLAPVRFVLESAGFNLTWDPQSRTIKGVRL